MRHLPLTSIIPLAGAVITCVVCLGLTLKARASARSCLSLAVELEEKSLAMSAECEQLARRMLDQTIRLEWLEARARSPRLADDDELVSSLAAAAKPSITERRHRVLSLARRGLDAATIAATLGAPHGEVELMIELNNATLGVER